MTITVATCQFPVDADIRRNLAYVLRQMRIAKSRGAHVAHFPECSLSGYAGSDFASYKEFDWSVLKECTPKVLALARELRLWVIVGSTHRLTARHKPHNSLYIVTDRGELLDRYDKMFCAGDRGGKSGDLAHYSSGNHFSVFSIAGVRCGALICHDYRYPELYREYKRRGVQLMFHSYHAAHVAPDRLKAIRDDVGARLHRINNGSTLPEITMRAAMHAAASNNYMWISCSNSSARESCWPAFFVRPDGVITGRLRRNTAGVLISTVDTKERFYDSTVAWRERSMRGVFHSGALVRDKRSDDRTTL
ncbi:MAG: carbon-nitrogen hydrolase family protein [Deltaproteobacteria bacterium]|nr:carbon-nitrogen hydrolase family protein [Deltaproteobacteria bacterium]MBI3389970.1 carbon-nitrogen hydrolase family protein [Deltaproteobacteria bacterium]